MAPSVAAAAPSCCHRQLQLQTTTRDSTEAAASNHHRPRTPSDASPSASCTPSPTTAEAPSSAPSSPPPPSRPSSTDVPGPDKDIDLDGTISPMELYQHYEQVARRLFRVLDDAYADSSLSQSQSPPPPPPPSRALDWPLSTEGLDCDLTLEELPVSPNSLLPEYQLTQEWFERVVEELREAEELRDKARAVVGAEEGETAAAAGHERH